MSPNSTKFVDILVRIPTYTSVKSIDLSTYRQITLLFARVATNVQYRYGKLGGRSTTRYYEREECDRWKGVGSA